MNFDASADKNLPFLAERFRKKGAGMKTISVRHNYLTGLGEIETNGSVVGNNEQQARNSARELAKEIRTLNRQAKLPETTSKESRDAYQLKGAKISDGLLNYPEQFKILSFLDSSSKCNFRLLLFFEINFDRCLIT